MKNANQLFQRVVTLSYAVMARFRRRPEVRHFYIYIFLFFFHLFRVKSNGLPVRLFVVFLTSSLNSETVSFFFFLFPPSQAEREDRGCMMEAPLLSGISGCHLIPLSSLIFLPCPLALSVLSFFCCGPFSSGFSQNSSSIFR